MHKKTVFGRAAALMVGIALAFVCAEAGLRAYGAAALHWQWRRNAQLLRAGNAYRVMCLGESTTMGQYPRFLESALNAVGNGRKFVVLDRGVTGTHTNEILSHLERNLDEYRPDIVVTMMGINSADSVYINPSRNMFVRLRLVQLAHWLFRLRFLSRGSETAVVSAPVNLPPAPQNCRLYPHPDFGCIEALAASGAFEKAEKMYGLLISSAPYEDRESACVLLSELQSGRGNFDGANATLRHCRKILPSCHLYIQSGKIARQGENYEESRRLLKIAAEGSAPVCTGEKRGEAYLQLSETYDELSRVEEVEAALRKAIECKPGVSEWHYLLGNYLAEHGRKAEAAEEFEKTLALLPPNAPRTYGLLAALAEMTGDRGLASRAKNLELSHSAVEAEHYRLLKRKLFERGIPLVAVQYPMRPVEELKTRLEYDPRVVFVDNEALFKDLVRQNGYGTYFVDRFAGDFGHCTDAGNRLLAKNIADAILAALN